MTDPLNLIQEQPSLGDVLPQAAVLLGGVPLLTLMAMMAARYIVGGSI